MIYYFKQAWNLIKQEKLFSSIYIIGTGLSITIVMVLSIVLYIKFANIYPETNRDRMLVTNNGVVKDTIEGGMSSSALSLNFIEMCFRPLSNVEAMSAVYNSYEEYYVQPAGTKEQLPITVKFVDIGFWKVFSFNFLKGSQFTEADFQSGIRTAVISEYMAKRLFGTIDVIGNYVSLNFMQYRICGVAKDVSSVTLSTYAHLWIPYTVLPDYNDSFDDENLLGNFSLYILAPSKDQVAKIQNEAYENIKKINNTLRDGLLITLSGQPDKYRESIFREGNFEFDFNKIKWQYFLVFLFLLLVPGISLSGMVDSRMERRISEMGIRRTFGAPVKTLMLQIFTENFLFTIIGGLIGLLFSYLLIILSADWIMYVDHQHFADLLPEGETTVISPTMLINIPVFLIALGVCFLLNSLTTLIPAWRSSKKEITKQLKIES